jgi:hypothetical protein
MVTLKEARTFKLEVFRNLPQWSHWPTDVTPAEMQIFWKEGDHCGGGTHREGPPKEALWFEHIDSYEVAKDLEGTELYAQIFVCARVPAHEHAEFLHRYGLRSKLNESEFRAEVATWRPLDLEHTEVIAWWGVLEIDELCLIRTMAFLDNRFMRYSR